MDGSHARRPSPRRLRVSSAPEWDAIRVVSLGHDVSRCSRARSALDHAASRALVLGHRFRVDRSITGDHEQPLCFGRDRRGLSGFAVGLVDGDLASSFGCAPVKRKILYTRNFAAVQATRPKFQYAGLSGICNYCSILQRFRRASHGFAWLAMGDSVHHLLSLY